MKLRWAAHLAVICALPFASALLANKDRATHVPFQVALVKKAGLGTGDSRFVDNFKCSGVLYELDYVWTTKTCLDKFSDKADIIVLAGISDLTASNVVPATNQRGASEWWKHPNAQVLSWANYDNVGALKLDSAFVADSGKIGKAVGVVDNNALGGLKGTDVDVTGWGSVTKANPKPTAKLQELNGQKYKLETLPDSDFPKNGEMALSLQKAELERGVCDFDEGSPVFEGSSTSQTLIGITTPGCALSKEPVTASKFDVALGYVHYKSWLEAVKNNNAPTTTPCTTKLTNNAECPKLTDKGSQHFATLGPVCVQTDPSSATSVTSCPRSKCTPLAFAAPTSPVNGATTSFDITRTGNSCVDGTAPIHREAKLLSTDGTTVVGTCTVKNSGAAYSCSKTSGTTSIDAAIVAVRETSNLKIAHAETSQVQFTQAAPTIAPGKSQANYLKINGTDKANFATPVKMTWDNTQLVDTKPKTVEFFAVDPLGSSSFSDGDAENAKDRWVRLTDKIDATAKGEEILHIPIPNKQIEEMMHSTTGVTSDVKNYKIITRTTGGDGLHSDFVTDLEINDREGGGLATDSRQRQMVRDVLYSGNPVQAANMTTKMLDDGSSEDTIREQIANSLALQAKSKSLNGLTATQGTKAAASVEGFQLLSENAQKHGLTETLYNHYHTYVGNMASNNVSKPGYANIRRMMGVTQKLKSFKTSGHKLAIKALLIDRELKEFEMLQQMTQLLREYAVDNFKADNKRVNEAYFACSDGTVTTRDNCAKTQSQTFITAAVSNKAGLDQTMGGVTYKGATPAINLGTDALVQRSTIEYFTASGPNPFDKATVDKDKGLKEWRASSILPELRQYQTAAKINQEFTSGPTATMNIISGTDGGTNLVADRDYCTTRSTVVASSSTLTWKSNPTISGSTFTCPINRVSNQFYSVGYQFKAGEQAIFNSIETDESSDDDGSSSGGSLWFLWAALFIICLCCIVAAVFMMMKKKGKSSPANHTAAAPQTSYGIPPPNTTPTDAVPVGNHAPPPLPQTNVGDVYGQAAGYGNQPPPFFDQDGNPINK